MRLLLLCIEVYEFDRLSPTVRFDNNFVLQFNQTWVNMMSLFNEKDFVFELAN
jgi:hypothetical protein